MIRIQFDDGRVFERQLTELERSQLPFAAMQAANATAFAVRERWAEEMPRVFDKPTSLTLRAVLYRKATRQDPGALVFIRDEAYKGTPPAKYLLAEVYGGQRRHKAFERRLHAAGVLPAGMYAVAGKGAPLDAHGNVPGRVVTQVLSALRANPDAYSNVSEASTRRRRAKRASRGGEFFALKQARGRLKPGVYERIQTGFGSAVRSIFRFVERAGYRPRLDIFGLAERLYRQQFPFHFEREFGKAVENARLRRGG